MKSLKITQLIWSLLLITIYPFLAYFILIPYLGFYDDDWLFAYIGHFYKTPGLLKAFIGDRPFVGYLFALNNILIGSNLILWHIYMFLIRLIGGYALFFLLKKIWPDKLPVISFITILFLIYPGFLQQTNPLGYQNYLTSLTIWIISLLFTVWAINKNQIAYIVLTLLALIFQLSSFLLLEFFIGMEVLRFLIVFHLLGNKINLERIKEKFIHCSPYIVSLLIFLVWRIFIFKATRHATDINWVAQAYYTDPLWIAKIPLKIIYSWVSSMFLAYLIPVVTRLLKLPLEVAIGSIFLGVISSSLLLLYYKISAKFDYFNKLNNLTDRKLGRTLFFIGLISTPITFIPIVMSGRFASVFLYNNNYNRYTISSIVSVVFIYIGILLWKTSNKVFIKVVMILVIISTITQITNGYWYSKYWDSQKEIWWQLYWRAPSVEKNTLLIFDFPQTTDTYDTEDEKVKLYQNIRFEDYQIWAPGNLFFNFQKLADNHFGGQFSFVEDINSKIKNKIVENITEENSAVTFTKNFNNTIFASLPTQRSCLWILDKVTQELPEYPSKLAKLNVQYSNANRLLEKDAFKPPSQIFGVEPPKNWCYYFQKVSFYRQLKDWKEVSNLTDEVKNKMLKPQDINEWLPFIEGLVVVGKFQEAKDLINSVYIKEKYSKVFKDNLCKMAKRLRSVELEYYCNDDNLRT